MVESTLSQQDIPLAAASAQMNLRGLVEALGQQSVFQRLVTDLSAASQSGEENRSSDFDIIRAARPCLLAALHARWAGPILVLTARGKRAHNITEQLPVWMEDPSCIHRFAEPTPQFYDHLPWDMSAIHERLGTLAVLSELSWNQNNRAELSETPSSSAGTSPDSLLYDGSHSPIIVAMTRALLQKTMPATAFAEATLHLAVGQRHDLRQLAMRWVELGYEPASLVIEPGTFSRRGGILDVYPIGSVNPVRIDFFDDEIDSIRTFDPRTQRTETAIDCVRIVPARELLPAQLAQVHEQTSTFFDTLRERQIDDEVYNNLLQDAEPIEQGQTFPYMEFYLPYAYNETSTLLDYLPANTLIVVEDPDDFVETVRHLTEQAETNRDNNQKSGQLADDYPLPYASDAHIAAALAQRLVLNIGNLPRQAGEQRLFSPGERYAGQLRQVVNSLHSIDQKDEVAVVVTQQPERIRSLWDEQNDQAMLREAHAVDTLPDATTLVEGFLGEGWQLHGDDRVWHLITDAEIFNWSRPEPRRRQSGQRQAYRTSQSDYRDWEIGDYVVHIDYGVGRFDGLQTRTVEDNEREYLRVQYEGSDSLLVPVHQADRLTRYVGPEDQEPVLSSLSKASLWVKKREKARENAREEAEELLNIYAHRAASSGHSYQPDTPWQHELEASFPFVETEDQLRTLSEIKLDMESPQVMDRLVCGDVGYGKTEVALRAAFKAVMDNRQVAVLVPTTVLAEQHYQTFSRRLAPFPLRVELLSRFRTKAEQTAVLKDVAKGSVEIIIGTHRLLSKDVKFHNLGLVIIDEEQRFGVKHKEHFKKLRANVDVLTLTATPIPRTMYMSLSGVRDISMIQTPPEERLPVLTHVGPFDDKLVRQAILRELDRGGQVFVIHNRVRSIEKARERFMELVPEASFIVGHGQMSGPQLEKVIRAFSNSEYDVLLATSIIENGIDMPNVNTLIVDHAEWFGMSQLYQIRGRVGRGAQQAYAYFFTIGGQRLTEEAKSRLEALAEYTQLGAGFQVAAKDLELRGSGDILSTKQTGYVADVGLHLYTQLLQQAVAELKGERDENHHNPVADERIIIDLPVPAYIPDTWIPDMSLRLDIYQQLGSLATQDELQALREELRDRFGELPRAVRGLLYQIQVKLLARDIHATAVMRPRERILIKLPWLQAIDIDSLSAQLKDYGDVSRTAVEFVYSRDEDEQVWQARLVQLMRALRQGLPASILERDADTA